MKSKSILNAVILISLIVYGAGSVFRLIFSQSAYVVGVTAWAMLMIVNRRWLVRRSPLDWFFLAYLVIGLFSSFLTQADPLFFIWKRLLLIPVVYWMAVNISDEKRLRGIWIALFATVFIIAVMGIFQYFSGVGGLSGRLSLFQHYMTTGGMLMFASLMAFAFALVPAPWRIRAAAAATGVMAAVPLILTFTRSAWLGFLGGITFMAVLQNKKWLIPLVLAVTVLLIFSPPALKDRIASVFDPVHPRNIERTYMWRAGLEILRDHPVTGVGDRDLHEVYEQYRPPESVESQGHLHNNIIMFGATMGIPGVLIYLALFGRLFWAELTIYRRITERAWLLKGTALSVLGVFWGFQINGLFEWNFGDAEISMLLWMSVGMVFAVEALWKNKTGGLAADG